MTTLEKKVILVTGGSKGIGYGIAESLLQAGARVIITSRSQNTVDEALAKLAKAGAGKITGFAADVRDLAAQEKIVAHAIQKWGKLDVVVANAGLGHFNSVEKITPEQWQETIDTNLTGVFYSIKASIEALKQSKGYFITIASLAGTNFFAGGSAYNASKFGVVGFTQAVIMPGSVATEFNGAHSDKDESWKIQPEDLGQIVVDLLRMHPRTLPSKIEVRPSMPK
jgi:NAD(P)-dependent dehydrogenase (short-subunit alcohol dehydrogenase family)